MLRGFYGFLSGSYDIAKKIDRNYTDRTEQGIRALGKVEIRANSRHIEPGSGSRTEYLFETNNSMQCIDISRGDKIGIKKETI